MNWCYVITFIPKCFTGRNDSVPSAVYICTVEHQNLWWHAVTYVHHAVTLRVGDYKGRKLARMMLVTGRPSRTAPGSKSISENRTSYLSPWRLGYGPDDRGIGVLSLQRLVTSVFPTKLCIHLSSLWYVLRAPTHVVVLGLITRIIFGEQILTLIVMYFFPFSS